MVMVGEVGMCLTQKGPWEISVRQIGLDFKDNCSVAFFLSSPRAESARAVTGRQNSYRWEGGRLFEPSAEFFYGNSCNSGTESRKIVSKVGN